MSDIHDFVNSMKRTLIRCRACGRPLGNLNIFCRVCYDALPHKERSSLLGMWRRKENLDSKIAKCCRLLREKRVLETIKPVPKPLIVDQLDFPDQSEAIRDMQRIQSAVDRGLFIGMPCREDPAYRARLESKNKSP